MVLTRLEDEASQNREAVRATAERATTAAAEERARALNAAQELETKAMERCASPHGPSVRVFPSRTGRFRDYNIKKIPGAQ